VKDKLPVVPFDGDLMNHLQVCAYLLTAAGIPNKQFEV